MTVRSATSWLRVALDRRGDLVLAAALTAFTQVDVWTGGAYLEGSKPLFALTTLFMTVPLAWRRRRPFAVSLTVAGALLVQVALEPSAHPPDAPFLAWIVASYSLAAHASLGRSLAGGAALIVAVDTWAYHTGDDLVFVPVILAGFWIVGRVVRSRNELAGRLVERTHELERERGERERSAVAEERTRIAREIHDIVAHTLGVIVVQAGAERLNESPGSAAHEALASIERQGREALGEMGRLVGVLRTDADGDRLAPQPGLHDLDSLVAGVRGTGVEVELVIEGSPRPLGPALDVSVYRIVQEALTNTLRHARCRRARVVMHWEPSTLRIEIADDGVGPPADPPSTGHGLLGIRERVALFGGLLVTGRSDLGGFLLAATLPLST